jgi:hypothetical protein
MENVEFVSKSNRQAHAFTYIQIFHGGVLARWVRGHELGVSAAFVLQCGGLEGRVVERVVSLQLENGRWRNGAYIWKLEFGFIRIFLLSEKTSSAINEIGKSITS